MQTKHARLVPFSVFCLCIVLLNCSCTKKVHDAEKRGIPKVLVLTSNINDIAPELSISIRTEFESLPVCWYCQNYSIDQGAIPRYIRDTIPLTNKNGPIFVPLTCRYKTYCPYVLKKLYITMDLNNEIWISIHPQNNIDKGDTLKINNLLALQCEHTNSGIMFSESMEDAYFLALPENIGDSLYLRISLKFSQENKH